MGYYVDGDGYIHTNIEGTRMFESILEECNYPLEAKNGGDYESNRDGDWQVWLHDKYYEDYMYEFLKRIQPHTKSGEIAFVGEDNMAWRFHFRNGKWYEDEGEIVYKENGFEI